MRAYIALLRPYQYVKNLFVFLPLFFGLKISDSTLFLNACAAFISFCLTASAVYVLNDLRDVEDDRKHPTKRNRPLASNAVTIRSAYILLIFVLCAAFVTAALSTPDILLYLAIYFVINIFYSIKLKHIPIIDIFIVAIGFILRIFVGSAATNIELSKWIIIMTFLLALFLALAKRRDDVLIFLNTGTKLRKVIDGYSLDFINTSMVTIAAVVLMAYLMYTTAPAVLERIESDNLYLTSFFVILGIMRYLQITLVENNSGNPTQLLLRDKFLLATVVGWIIALALILY